MGQGRKKADNWVSNPKKTNKEERRKKRREEKEAGVEVSPRVPNTLENTREADDTVVQEADQEIIREEAMDEFADFFRGKQPKVLITTGQRCGALTERFIRELLQVIPESMYRHRRQYTIPEIVQYCKHRDFTAVIVIEESNYGFPPDRFWIISLPDGPTALFRLSSIKLRRSLPNHGAPTSHFPEMILHNFTTRVGHRVARLFASMFPQQPEFEGRRVATFHNMRDFIFFRQHRYIFDSAEKARLQELGPRFTLRLLSLQKGSYDVQNGEYEWLPKKEMNTSKRRFAL